MTVEPGPGELVRWEKNGQWFTATVKGRHSVLPAWIGEVVDPGNWYGPNGLLMAGEVVPNLRDQFLTVMSDD